MDAASPRSLFESNREDSSTDITGLRSRVFLGRPEVEVEGYKETVRSDRARDKSGRGKAQVYRAIIYSYLINFTGNLVGRFTLESGVVSWSGCAPVLMRGHKLSPEIFRGDIKGKIIVTNGRH